MGPTSRLRLAALAAALLLPACSQHTTEPSMRVATTSAQAEAIPLAGTLAQKEVGLVDLTIGRVTRVEGEERLREIPAGGTPGDWQVTSIGFRRTVRGDVTPVVTGPSYRAEDEVALDNPAEVIRTDLWRQDRSGLFAFQPDLAVSRFRPLARSLASGVDAAHAAAIDRAVALLDAKRAAVLGAAAEMPARRVDARGGGPGAHEITFLRYPLHPGATWEGRPGFNVWIVEAKEQLDTAAGRFHAGRMRIDVPGQLGPDDFALTWWAEPGEVKRHFHFLVPMTDQTGQVTGTLEADETFVVTEYTP